jgi:nucleoside-diphosphate-sugar epimerase
MEKVLITGASGFIGSFLVEEALRQGFEVYAGVRQTSSREYLKDERIKFFELDLFSAQALQIKFEEFVKETGGFDYVIHNAGITYARTVDEFTKVNYECTCHLTNALQASAMPLKKFLLISSLAVFGPGNSSSYQPIKISDVPKPISSYAKSKLVAEKHVKSLTDFPYLVLNPTAVYGPCDKDFLELVKMINAGLEFYIGKTRQMISLIYVKDLARAAVLAMKSPKANHSYLISDGAEYDKEYLSDVMKRVLNKKTIQLKLPETPLRWAIAFVEKIYSVFGKRPFLNVEKLNEIRSVNWLCQSDQIWIDIHSSPEFTLENGMEETIGWYKLNGWIK